ncbi:MAG: glycosyltransferase family 2 protein [Fibrobacter sp.]|nr:glycosyltransferase family 2 protein [Fibrobacter sp.]
MDVGIINYNGGEELLRCVKSLTAQTLPVRVFVFDNASSDNSLELLQKSGEPCEIIRSDKNLGYAGACNGLRKNMTSDIQVLCNMDLDFERDWAKNLLHCFDRHPDAASVASLVMERSGVVNAIGVLFGEDLFAENEGSGKNAKDVDIREKEVFGCYGAVMAFRKECAEKVGELDESFFLFFEESEWYFRFNLCGFKTIFCPSAQVFHERSLTTVRYSPRKLYYSERNRLRSAVRLLPWKRILQLPIIAFKRYLNMAKGGVPKQSSDGKKLSKISICNALMKAWIEAFLAIPKEWKIRKSYEARYKNVPRKTLEILERYPLKGK